MTATFPTGLVVNIINAEKADELVKLGFHCTIQKMNDDKIVYQFVASPKLMTELSGQFERTDFFLSKTMFL